MSKIVKLSNPQSVRLCGKENLVADSGVCALWNGQQIALFYLPEAEPQIYAISNWDPIGKAAVLSRGMVGDLEGAPVVASPLYKQHFNLITGFCIEDSEISVPVYQVSLSEDGVWLRP